MYTGKYNHIISLGYYCGPAMELERIGLRLDSLPLDWLISSSFENVLSLIKTRFSGFMCKENMLQEYDINPNYYYDSYSAIHFYHDFSCHIPFDEQYDGVRKKYNRRIKRFYEFLADNSLLVRYIENREELIYILNNIESINEYFHSFNSNNDIIFIVNEDIVTNFQISNQFFVVPNSGKKTLHHFLSSIPKAKDFFQKSLNISKYQRLCTLVRYRKKRTFKIIDNIKRKFETPKIIYKHSKLYQE